MSFLSSQGCASITTVNFRTVYYPQTSPLPTFPSPLVLASTNFPFLYICLFWTFDMNQIMKYTILCDWLH